jgi:carbon monoxide dehydrogenase subunit G
MKLEQSFEVQAPLEQVWQALIDVERVAPCLPGAEVTGRNDDGTYNGSFKVKIGPTAAAYSGKLAMQEVDESAHRATMDANGTDRRGQGGAKATIVSSVEPAGPNATRVSVDTDYHITGRLARFGRGGMIEEISNRLLGEFARNLQDMLAHEQSSGGGPTPAAAAPTGADAQVPATQVAGQAAVDDTLEAPAREQGEATAQTLTEAAKRVAEAGDPSATQAPDARAVTAPAADQPAPLGADEAAAEMAGAAVPPAGGAAVPEAAPAAAQAAVQAVEPPAVEPPAVEPPAVEPPAVEPPTPAQNAWTPPASQSEGVDGLSLVGSVLADRIKRNPIPVVALVLGFLLALRVLRRGER